MEKDHRAGDGSEAPPIPVWGQAFLEDARLGGWSKAMTAPLVGFVNAHTEMPDHAGWTRFLVATIESNMEPEDDTGRRGPTPHHPYPKNKSRFWIDGTWGEAISHNARSDPLSADHWIYEEEDRLWLLSYGGFGEPTLRQRIPMSLERFSRMACRLFGAMITTRAVIEGGVDSQNAARILFENKKASI